MEESFNFHSFIKSGVSFKIKIDEAQNTILDYYIKKQGKVDVSESKKIIEQVRTLNELRENLIQNLHSIEHFFFIGAEENLLKLKDSDLKINPTKIDKYIIAIIRIISENKIIGINSLKSGLYNRIKDQFTKYDFILSKKYISLFNWEVHYYQALTFLKRKEFIKIDESTNMLEYGPKAIKILDNDENDFQNGINDMTASETEQNFEVDDLAGFEDQLGNRSLCEIKDMILSNMRKDRLIDNISYKECTLMILHRMINNDNEEIQDFSKILLDEKYTIQVYELNYKIEIKITELFNVYNVFVGKDNAGRENLYFFNSRGS